MVRALIEKGADIKKVVDGGFTPLLMAAEKGHDAVVRALIEADVDINKATDIGMPPLYMAAEFGREAVVLALIKAGADVNKAMDNGATPLSTSMTKKKTKNNKKKSKNVNVAREGHAAIVQILKKAGAVRRRKPRQLEGTRRLKKNARRGDEWFTIGVTKRQRVQRTQQTRCRKDCNSIKDIPRQRAHPRHFSLRSLSRACSGSDRWLGEKRLRLKG